jgi:hypothetical protein
VSKRTSLSWLVFALASIVLLTEEVVEYPRTSFAEPGYSIRYVSAIPKRGSHFAVGDHIVLSVTVAYKLAVTDKGRIVLVLQKDDNSQLTSGHKQVQTEVSRGSGETTLTDEFDVPAGTSLVRVFIPLIPAGYKRTSGEVVIEYPVKKR